MRSHCLPAALTDSGLERFDRVLVGERHTVSEGKALFRRNDRFRFLYAVWTGFFKTVATTRPGREQVTGFHMAGDLIGLDGIAEGCHQVDAVALEDSQVCVVPYAELQALARDAPSLQEQFHRLMGHEVARNLRAMTRLGSMHADERLAVFLLDLAERLSTRGFSARSLVLRMSRAEIASYLGLTPETVSRTLSIFQAEGLLSVAAREICIIDAQRLQRVLDVGFDLDESEARCTPGAI